VGQKIDVVITYLEQTDRPALRNAARPTLKFAILRAENPPVHFYRYLYRLIGDPYHWVSRRRLTDAELAKIITDPKVYVYVLYIGGVPAGLAEVDNRSVKGVEIKFFGLAQEWHGRGLGRYFLTQVVDLAWDLMPKRVRLETCTLDHPAALPLYQKLGFTVFDQRKGQVELIDE
jgi:GNAT superfamily N-acetyltransferase